MNKRWAYKDSIINFLNESSDSMLGKITNRSENLSESNLQIYAWNEEIRILKENLYNLKEGYIAFEYTIPRIGGRVDSVLLYKGIVFLLEFKVGESTYSRSDIDQVVNYALDLKNFHKESLNKKIIPILISSEADYIPLQERFAPDLISTPVLCNENNLKKYIEILVERYQEEDIVSDIWFESPYAPTPTIIEAAQYLYRNKNVEDISRHDAGTYNLSETTNIVKRIIKESKTNHKKSICFITGVPGAGKTLAGLNIANETQNFDEDEHAVFLSGNLPLVEVLQEALARDAVQYEGITKRDALRKTKSYIQIIHHFRDDAVNTTIPPHEKVVIFDEAQRSWDEKQLSSFMKMKKGVPNFNMSEPEFLIEYLDRHDDWATIICLIGGGQEINTGEAGLEEWFNTLSEKYPEWNVYVSDMIYDKEYTNNQDLRQLLSSLNNLSIEEKLHLSVSARSFRTEKQSEFIKHILDLEEDEARITYEEIKDKFPLKITRDLNKAKNWVKENSRGTERYGLIGSSSAIRLRKHNVWVKNNLSNAAWFLNDKDDVRSSYMLEECATEFNIQGLELDWTIVGWGGDLRHNGLGWDYLDFRGSKWNNINQEERKKYLINSYRVLLTRARQGMIIFIPEGDNSDKTALPEFYNNTFNYLKRIGVEEI